MYIAPLHNDGSVRTRITLLQGLAEVSSDPAVLLTTVLGSCVATCLFDPVARVGGMNHFHLAHVCAETRGDANVQYGTHMMESLISGMLDHGADRLRLRAHVYGGADLHAGGSANTDFVKTFLDRQGILISRQDTGGTRARKVELLAAAGKVRCRHVDREAAPIVRGSNKI